MKKQGTNVVGLVTGNGAAFARKIRRRMQMKIDLTKGQCVNLAEFIEMHIFEAIRSDVDIDNIEWLRDMLDAQKTFSEAGKEES
jgi:hypothetical protein